VQTAGLLLPSPVPSPEHLSAGNPSTATSVAYPLAPCRTSAFATSVRQGDIVEFCAPAGIEQIEDAHPRSVSGLEGYDGGGWRVGSLRTSPRRTSIC
jgi:hypothetical protein